MKKITWQRGLEAAFLAAIAVLLAVRFGPQVLAAVGVGGESTDAPEVQVTTIAGEKVTLADLRGQVVLVNFWATWCGPCRVEMPGMQRVYERHRDEGFTILALSTDAGTPDLVREFIAQYELTFPVAAATVPVREAFGGIPQLPMSFLIGRDGTIRHRVTGLFAEPALSQAVKRLLAEPVPAASAP